MKPLAEGDWWTLREEDTNGPTTGVWAVYSPIELESTLVSSASNLQKPYFTK